jgi:hypothetical protein
MPFKGPEIIVPGLELMTVRPGAAMAQCQTTFDALLVADPHYS